MKDLAIIIPIYNEETGLKSFIVSCIDEFNNLNIDYNIILYNDGSSNENTKKILEELNSQYEVITLVNKKNSGHGPTILEGYKKQSKNYKWIFQIDSDNEMPITYFKELWLKRNDSTFLIGKRTGRMQKLARGILSFSSRPKLPISFDKIRRIPRIV
jgi:dolichol-phosphate mannosyltransferase